MIPNFKLMNRIVSRFYRLELKAVTVREDKIADINRDQRHISVKEFLTVEFRNSKKA
jgi:hypothetical protein